MDRKFIEIIRDYRKKRGYSQNKMANLLGVSELFISNIENEKKDLSIEALSRILSILEIDIFKLLNEDLKRELPKDCRDYCIRKILENNKKWYLPESGLWNKRYMNEMELILTVKRTQRECNIIERYIKEKSGKIIDVACGYGRISNFLGNRGYNITGIDINNYFINIAKKDAKRKNLNLRFYTADLFGFYSKEKFDVVLNIFTSLGYFESEERNELFIKKLCSLVKCNGILIIETINPFRILKNYKTEETKITKNRTKIIQERFFDPKRSINIERITD